ncbi:MAG: c-type cytochrome [Thermoanaerobaculia bacterium]
MRKGTQLVATLGFVAGLAMAVDARAADGKAVFLAQKCDMCHSVSSAGITATTKSEKMKGPDLTGVVQGLDPVWLKDFLQKKVDKEGKKHSKEYKGTAEDLDALVGWLCEQKKA